MKYGYFSQFVTAVGEDVSLEISEISKFADEVVIDTLGSRPKFAELVKKAKSGDIIFVYSFNSSFFGLADVNAILPVLFGKGVSVVSIKDGLTFDHSENGKIAYNSMLLAAKFSTYRS